MRSKEDFGLVTEYVKNIESCSGFVQEMVYAKGRKALKRTISREGYTNIGGLSESTLHLVLKYFIEEDNFFHEVSFGAFFVDVMRDDFAYEIQTGNFSSLRKKLAFLLEHKDVTVVLPVVSSKRVIWTDVHTGELSGFRKSPQKEDKTKLFDCLISVCEYLGRENLHFLLFDVECDDYRVGKKGTTRGCRYDRVPTRLKEIYCYESVYVYLKEFIGEIKSGAVFTSARLCESFGLDLYCSRIALKILCSLGFAREDGREGRYKKYLFIKDF